MFGMMWYEIYTYAENTHHYLRIAFDYLLFLCIIGHAMIIERSEHLNPQDSVEEQEKEQKYGHTPDLLSGSPLKEKEESAHN